MIRELIEGFIQQLHNAIKIGQKIKVTEPKNEIRQVMVAGMGGSGIGANLVESFVNNRLKIPYTIVKSYDAPVSISPHTLLVACSFSGNTEETLAVVEQASKKRAKVFCITSGGNLLDLAQKHKWDYVQLPNEAPCPRAFVGYSFIQILFALKAYQLISGFFTKDLQESIALLDERNEEIHRKAQFLARELFGKYPIFYADIRNQATILRLQQQINENAKQLCHTNFFPEMNHNELVGWGLIREVYLNTVVLMVHTTYDHERVSKRMEISKNIFAEKAFKVLEIQAEGLSYIAQSLYLVHLFDWLSFYLAEHNQVDVFEIKVIDYLKSELAAV